MFRETPKYELIIYWGEERVATVSFVPDRGQLATSFRGQRGITHSMVCHVCGTKSAG